MKDLQVATARLVGRLIMAFACQACTSPLGSRHGIGGICCFQPFIQRSCHSRAFLSRSVTSFVKPNTHEARCSTAPSKNLSLLLRILLGWTATSTAPVNIILQLCTAHGPVALVIRACWVLARTPNTLRSARKSWMFSRLR